MVSQQPRAQGRTSTMVNLNSQRFEALEGGLTGVRQGMEGLESKVQQLLAEGMEAFQKTLAQNFVSKSAEDTQENQEAVEAATVRLEGRMDRFREDQTCQLALMKRNQEQFQEEIKKLLANKPPAQNLEGEDCSENQVNQERRAGRNFERVGFDDGGGGNGGHWKYHNLDMPLFEGKDPDGWILRGEKYFDFYKLNEKEKMEAAVVSMEGDALRWYTFKSRRHPMRTWVELKVKVLSKYRSTNAGTLHEQWLDFTSNGSPPHKRRRWRSIKGCSQNWFLH